DYNIGGSDAFYTKYTFSYANNGIYTTGRVSQVSSEIRRGANTSILSSSTYKFAYDENGFITQIKNGSNVVQYSYEYDDLGQLIRENNRPLNQSIVYTYVYEFICDIIQERDGSLLTDGSEAFQRKNERIGIILRGGFQDQAFFDRSAIKYVFDIRFREDVCIEDGRTDGVQRSENVQRICSLIELGLLIADLPRYTEANIGDGKGDRILVIVQRKQLSIRRSFGRKCKFSVFGGDHSILIIETVVDILPVAGLVLFMDPGIVVRHIERPVREAECLGVNRTILGDLDDGCIRCRESFGLDLIRDIVAVVESHCR
ncbi:MAG: hypothetical protein IKS35_02975, partial [Clostridia bacterium]|nr:hypothetical protein [Clostridia bacterium]